jgi:hypothetical protein
MRTSELGSRGAAMLVTQPVKSMKNGRVRTMLKMANYSIQLRLPSPHAVQAAEMLTSVAFELSTKGQRFSHCVYETC